MPAVTLVGEPGTMPSRTAPSFRLDLAHGKGSHGRVYVGRRSTTVQRDELKTGVLAVVLCQWSIDRREL